MKIKLKNDKVVDYPRALAEKAIRAGKAWRLGTGPYEDAPPAVVKAKPKAKAKKPPANKARRAAPENKSALAR